MRQDTPRGGRWRWRCQRKFVAQYALARDERALRRRRRIPGLLCSLPLSGFALPHCGDGFGKPKNEGHPFRDALLSQNCRISRPSTEATSMNAGLWCGYEMPQSSDLVPGARSLWFAKDSPPEGSGFEPSVPRKTHHGSTLRSCPLCHGSRSAKGTRPFATGGPFRPSTQRGGAP
jgi:hypothetical protein